MPIHRALLAASLAAALSLGANAFAQGMRPAQGHDGFAAILHSVQLTPSQQSQVHQIMHDARLQNAPVRAQLRSLQQQIEATLFSTGAVSAAQIAPLEQASESLRQQLDASRLQTALAIRAVLTQAQLANASSMQARLASLHQQEHAILSPAAAAAPE